MDGCCTCILACGKCKNNSTLEKTQRTQTKTYGSLLLRIPLQWCTAAAAAVVEDCAGSWELQLGLQEVLRFWLLLQVGLLQFWLLAWLWQEDVQLVCCLLLHIWVGQAGPGPVSAWWDQGLGHLPAGRCCCCQLLCLRSPRPALAGTLQVALPKCGRLRLWSCCCKRSRSIPQSSTVGARPLWNDPCSYVRFVLRWFWLT